jgi:hypothetical protein
MSVAAALGLLVIAALTAMLVASKHPTDSSCVVQADAWTTKVANGATTLADARRSLDARTYDAVAKSLITQIESNALESGHGREATPDTRQRIRLLCETT